MSVCTYSFAHMSGNYLRGQTCQITWSWNEIYLWAIWHEGWSSGNTENVLKCWALSPGPQVGESFKHGRGTLSNQGNLGRGLKNFLWVPANHQCVHDLQHSNALDEAPALVSFVCRDKCSLFEFPPRKGGPKICFLVDFLRMKCSEKAHEAC